MDEHTTYAIRQIDRQDNSLFSQSFLNLVPWVCALMVVLIHQYNIAESTALGFPARVEGFFSHGICTAAVPMFFFMSGYLFYRNLPTVNAVFHKQKKRAGSVLMPFLAWSASYYAFFALLSKVMPGELQKAVDLSLFGIVKGIIFYEYIFPMWYMFQLCLYILLAPIIFCVLKNRLFGILVLVGSAIVGLFILPGIGIDVGGYERSLFQFNFFAYYFAGCFAAKWPDIAERIKAFACKLSPVVSAGLCVAFSFICSLFFDEVIPVFNTRCIVPFVFITFMLLMINLCEKITFVPSCAISTMFLYGVHSLVGLILGEVFLDALPISALLKYGVSFILVTVVSLGIGYVLKFVKPLYRVFSGNR